LNTILLIFAMSEWGKICV